MKDVILPESLFLIFLTLKLTHYIDWSWWWITAPLWLPLGLVLGIILVIFLSALISEVLK